MKNRLKNLLLHPRVAIVLHDFLMVWLSWLLVLSLRYSLWPDSPDLPWFPREMPLVLAIQALVLHFSGLYRGIWRFASLPDLWNILRAAVIGSLGIFLALFLVNRLEGIPRSAFAMYPVLLTFLLGCPRIVYRVFKDHRIEFKARPGRSIRVLILGAGRTADLLAQDLRGDGDFYPIGFLDDDAALRGRKLQGLPVYGAIAELPRVVREKEVRMVVIALPAASREQMRRIVELCEQAGVEFRTVPRLQDLVSGRFASTELKTVAIEDLLGREPVRLDWDAIRSAVNGQAILVTGGGGSIGAELCRQVAKLSPARLGILENSEYNLYEIERELRQHFPDLVVDATLGDVCDRRAVQRVFERFQPDTVFHAAAYKQVPLLQGHLRAAARNNIIGTMTMARCARSAAIGQFVLISTDKAVNPANVMGATKRVAEIYCQLLATGSSRTRFLTVRFGNVLDSAGSVVPLFREQIQRGGPVTVTHPEVTRYFMTIPEACQLILETAAIGRNGEIYVLDMGEAVRIRDLAEQMIRLAGKVPGRDIAIVYTGLRAGEKLCEELFHEHEAYGPTGHHKIRRARHRQFDSNQAVQLFAQLEAAVEAFDEPAIARTLGELLPEYGPAEAATPESVANIVNLRTSRG